MRSLAVFLVFLFIAAGCSVGKDGSSRVHTKRTKYNHDKGHITKHRLVSIDAYKEIKEENSLPVKIGQAYHLNWDEYWKAYRKNEEATSKKLTPSYGYLLHNVKIIKNGKEKLIPYVYLRHVFPHRNISGIYKHSMEALINYPGWPSKARVEMGKYYLLHYIFLNNKREKLSNFTRSNKHNDIYVMIGAYTPFEIAQWAYSKKACIAEEFREKPLMLDGMVGNGLVDVGKVSNGYSNCKIPKDMDFFDWLDEYHGD